MKFRSGEIALEQVRLLLYKECDRRGRKILFDSSTIDKVLAGKNDKPNITMDKIPCIVEVSDGNAYIYKGQATDASALGEMIFGAVAMNCKSVSLKIHIMNDPKRLMCTKLFSVPVSRRISRMDKRMDNSEVNRSKPLNVTVREEGVSLSFSLDRGDSGFCGEQSSYSSLGSTCDYFSMFDTWDQNTDEYYFHSPSSGKFSSSSGSLARRTSQGLATRFELGNNLKLPTNTTVCSSDSQLYSSTTSTTDSLSSAPPSRRTKLGLALLITFAESDDMEVVRRWWEQAPQLQSLVCRLRLAALGAGGARGGFVSTLHAAAGDARRWLSDLLYGPRLQPVWLNLVTGDSRHTNKMADTLLSDLCFVLAVGDTKDTNFFISTLLTYVLTHHLGWVTTVSPYDTVDPQKGTKLDSRRSYNALWAQLTDLCGSIGLPPRSARTIITGSKNVQFINRLLAVLTYFIRCGEVRRNEFKYQDCILSEAKVISVKTVSEFDDKCVDLNDTKDSLKVPSYRSSGSASTLVSSVTLKKSATLADLNNRLSNLDFAMESGSESGTQLKRHPTMMISLKDSSDSSPNLSEDSDKKKVVFVLGDDEKLVGLKNKSNGGKSVKKTSKVVEAEDTEKSECNDVCKDKNRSSNRTSKCCGQTLKHSKPIKHSGFKFEFDKYPQIVTNYMKSKNLEILDRHYIGKPGNLKLDNFQFDPTFVPPIKEERCETCYKCQLMESMLQTPTNASEMEYMNDMPRQTEPQFAKETIIDSEQREMSPKTFVRKRKENTVIVNARNRESAVVKVTVEGEKCKGKDTIEVNQVIELPVSPVCTSLNTQSGYEASLLGGLTNHYVPDLILQGTIASPDTWESELRRDLDLTSYLNKSFDAPIQSVAIVGDTNTWEVRVRGRASGPSGLSPLVGGLMDALPAMTRARVPALQCLLFLESKLREFCVLSKTLADMLMSTDFCDIDTLTKSLNINVNDVPLLLAVATTHTPQLSNRYGISYR